MEWLWEFGDGTTSGEQNPVHTYEAQGSYEICLTVFGNENASDMYCTEILLDGSYISGIGENAELLAYFDVYPNPASDHASVEFKTAGTIQASINLYNGMMQKVGEIYSGQLKAGKHQLSIDLDKFSSGLYFIRLESGKQQLVKKLIIK